MSFIVRWREYVDKEVELEHDPTGESNGEFMQLVYEQDVIEVDSGLESRGAVEEIVEKSEWPPPRWQECTGCASMGEYAK